MVRPLATFEAFTDQIYEAAIVPELWPEVLSSIAKACNSIGGVLFAANPQFVGGIASPELTSIFAEFVKQGWAARNPRPVRAAQRRLRGFVSDHDLFTPEEMDADLAYAFMRSLGVGWCAGLAAPMPTGDLVVFSWERRFKDGPFDSTTLQSMNAMTGHLSRAALVAARLGLEKARAAAETMSAIGLPAAVLSPSTRLLVANELFQRFVPSLAQDRKEGLVIMDARADALLRQALCRVTGKAGHCGEIQSIPVAAKKDRLPMVIHVVPIRRRAQDVFSAATCMLVMTELNQAPGIEATLIQGLFDLTPAEARIAQAIVSGLQVKEIAKRHGVSMGTVRLQVKSVLAKTGTSRQLELVRLLSGAALSREVG
jgi:DNA-binding CsgD family transcriptional regulator